MKKKNFKYVTIITLTIIAIISSLFFPIKSEAARIYASNNKMEKGSIIRLNLYFYYGKDKTKWSVSNKKAKIVSKGKKWCKIEARKTGTVYVMCKIGEKEIKKKITIKPKCRITYENYKKIEYGMALVDVNFILDDSEEVYHSFSHLYQEYNDYLQMQREYGGMEDECYLEQVEYVWRNPWNGHKIYATFNDGVLIDKSYF